MVLYRIHRLAKCDSAEKEEPAARFASQVVSNTVNSLYNLDYCYVDEPRFFLEQINTWSITVS